MFGRLFGKKSDKIVQQLLALESKVSKLSPTFVYITDRQTNKGNIGDAIPTICAAISLAIKHLQNHKPRTAYSFLKALEQEIRIGIMQTEALGSICVIPIDSSINSPRMTKLEEYMKKLGQISNKIKREMLYEP